MRWLQIFLIWRRFQLGLLIQEFFPRPIKLYNPLTWIVHLRKCPKISGPERLCLALETLGPLYIKFGQLVSTRRDLIPAAFIQALSKLQDRVTPFDSLQARKIIELALGQKIEESFEIFEDIPLAAASIAQVHGAVLKDGRQVVVKVLRPGIQNKIKQDIELLYFLAKWLPKFYPDFKRFKLPEVVKEIESTLMAEIDLMAEAANASALKRCFSESDVGRRYVKIPEMIWELSRKNVLVSERMFGVPIGDREALIKAGVSLSHLAKIGVEVFYTQVFDFSFFHADLHPGNIFIGVEDPENPQYILVDFGIVGSLSPEDQHYLAANFLAFFERDYRKVAKLHIDSGWVPAKTRIDAFESAMRTVSEPVFGKALKDISLGITMGRLFQIAKQFEMEIQPQLLLLQKTLLNIEALGRDLDSDLDLWGSCRPFFKKWMKRQVGWGGLWRRLKAEAPLISERFPELPGMLYRALSTNAKAHQEPAKKTRIYSGTSLILMLSIGILMGILIAIFVGFWVMGLAF